MIGQVAMANTCLDSELLQHPSGIALEADMIFTSPNLSTASFNLLQNFHSSKSKKPQIPQETDSGTAPLKCLSRSATRMVATIFQDKWAMSTGLGSSSNAGGCQFEQKYPKPTSTSFSFQFGKKSGCWHSYKIPSTPHILQNLLHTALTHTIFWTVATLMSKQIGWFQALVVKKEICTKVRFSAVHVFLLSALQVPMSQNGLKLLSLSNPWLIISNLQRHEGDLREDHMESPLVGGQLPARKAPKHCQSWLFGWNQRYLWCKILVDLNFSDNFI